MKPFYFVEDLVKQLEGFNVETVDLELHVGGNGMVGDGNSTIKFTLNIAEYKSKRSSKLLKDIENMS